MRAADAPIDLPCDEDWDRMRAHPSGVERHCDRCCKSVHDLSAMGPERAREFLRRHDERPESGSICISYLVDSNDELVFESPAPKRASAFVPLARLAQAASLGAVLSACTPHELESERAPRIEEAPASPALGEQVLKPYARPSTSPPEQPCEAEQAPEPAPPIVSKHEPPLRKRGTRNLARRIRGDLRPSGTNENPLD